MQVSMQKECQPLTSEELVEMAVEALENWDFDASDDPYPAAKAGLESIIDGTFHHVPSCSFLLARSCSLKKV